MKKKKDIEVKREDLSKKLDILRLRVQEREARETEIELAISNALTRNGELDEELAAEIKNSPP